MDFAKKVEELLKMPQELCNMCGLCCKIATFKGGMSYEEIKEIASDYSNPSQADGARDFLTIFEPITQEQARNTAPDFFNIARSRFPEDRRDKVGFFKCRFIKDGSLCQIHEDRPLLCRMYPIPHERTVYHKNCGFKERGEQNWQEIKTIIESLQQQSQELEEKRQAINIDTENAIKESDKLIAESEKLISEKQQNNNPPY
jgi:Fe-S-cluster containining protein